MTREKRPYIPTLSDRHTKIVATIGPASADRTIIEEMIHAGADVFRINLAYKTHTTHQKLIESIREAEISCKRNVALLIDIPGPKLRLGALPRDPLPLTVGMRVVLTGTGSIPNTIVLPVSDPALLPTVYPGDPVLMADGAVMLAVLSTKGDQIVAEVRAEGTLHEGNGVVFPGRRPDVPFITEKLKSNLTFAAEAGADYIALSFVSNDADIIAVRDFLFSIGSSIPLIAKIEQESAVLNYQAILRVSDGIMVARGDLGVEMPIEQIPHIQKSVITGANMHKKPVITATEMLESMVTRGRPTRAEVTDVANAILDGTDALMLSAETSIGVSPVQAVTMMASIALETEKHLSYRPGAGSHEVPGEPVTIGDVISASACDTAMHLNCRSIVAFTRSGKTAHRASSCRPAQPILAITSDPRVYKRLLLWWGVLPVLHTPTISADTLFCDAMHIALATGQVSPGDTIVIIAGIPGGEEGSTNLIKVEKIPKEPIF